MKRNVIRTARLLLALVMVFALYAVPANAEEVAVSGQAPTSITPYWVVLGSVKPYMSVSNGTASFSVSVSGYASCTSFKVTATIQKSNLFWYDDVKTFTKTYYSSSGTFSDSYSVGSGTYRLKANVISYQNGVEKDNVTLYS